MMRSNTLNTNNKSIKIFKVASVPFHVKLKKISYIKGLQTAALP